MGKRTKTEPWPEERTSSKFLVSVDSYADFEDKRAATPEQQLIEAEERVEAKSDPPPAEVTPAVLQEFGHRIPAREVDYLRLTFEGVKQEQIAAVFGVSQAAVSYRIRRAVLRLQWLQTVPVLEPEADFMLALDDLRKRDRLVLWAVYLTTSQSKSKELMERWTGQRWSQGRIRQTVLSAFRRLRRLWQEQEAILPVQAPGDPRPVQERPHNVYDPYVRFFSEVIEGRRWNMLTEIKFPNFDYVNDATIITIDDFED